MVDTGFWIFGKKRLIPAGTVVGVDHDNAVMVNVRRTIKAAPDYEKDDWGDHSRALHTEHYTP